MDSHRLKFSQEAPVESSEKTKKPADNILQQSASSGKSTEGAALCWDQGAKPFGGLRAAAPSGQG